MTTIINPVRRVQVCEFCHKGTCARCGAVGLCHTESVYQGGRGFDLVDVCSDTRGCWERRGV